MGIFSLALGTGTRIGGGNAPLTTTDVTSTTGSPTITTSGIYTIYRYTGSGTISVNKNGLCDVLVVGGGGSGGKGDGNYGGPGGGAGGVVETSFYLVSGTYSITVGAGGAGGSHNATRSGGPSMAFKLVALGGGRAGSVNLAAVATTIPYIGQSGASTGGGQGTGSWIENETWGYVNPNNIPTQGNVGGGASGTGLGGGGGAGAVGVTGAGGVAGAGGVGVASTITGSSVYYGGGGGASSQSNLSSVGAGGNGGGGAGGATSTNGVSGTAHTGGGGGGNGGSANTGAGGSGVVIIRVVT